MIVHSSSSSSGGSIDEYADTLDYPDWHRHPIPVPLRTRSRNTSARGGGRTSQKLVEPEQEESDNDLGKMSREQMQIIVHRLLGCVDWRFENDDDGSIEELSESLRGVLIREPDNRPSVLAQDLHPSMIPILLEFCGYQEDMNERPSVAPADQISLSTVSMLAELRRRNRSLILETVSEDRKQNSVVRLTCVLSLVSAGGSLRTRRFWDIVQNEAMRTSVLQQYCLRLLA